MPTDLARTPATRSVSPEAEELRSLLADLRRAADTLARLSAAVDACLESLLHALPSGGPASDTQPASAQPASAQAAAPQAPLPAVPAGQDGAEAPSVHLVGHAVPPRRLVGTVSVHGFSVDPGRHTVRHGRRQALLTPNEWQLFALMLAQPGRTFTRDELATGAWGHGYAGRDSEVEVYISRLRRKLEFDPRSPLMIETVRGAGYRLVPPEEPDGHADLELESAAVADFAGNGIDGIDAQVTDGWEAPGVAAD